MRKFSLFFAVLVCVFSFSFAQIEILVNQVGYEKSGAKRAVIQSSSAITEVAGSLIDAQGSVVATINLGSQTTVRGWSGRNFKVADFSDFDEDGEYRLKVGTATSEKFAIGEKILQEKTGPSQVSFFNGMRNTDAGDRNLKIYNSSQTHNIYGGWWDATGDPGKHLSHLSYAYYFNPQQIPLVVWALLQANELHPTVYAAQAKAEAAWGADYLLRALSPQDFFYMSVFDNWGGWNGAPREICAWSGSDGVRSTDYQSAMREGGGVSIAALAKANKAGISGDSSSAQYLDGAERAYAHLKANPTRYQDDGKENIIDDYTGLLAASELYNATEKPQYLADAQTRVASLIALQSEEGWFYSDRQKTRPFYHAADEGLPVVALARYVEICKPSDAENIQRAINKNFQWYISITYQESNPFEYVKMRGTTSAGTDPTAVNLALGSTATASRSEGAFTPEKAIDGGPSNDSRWSSYENGAKNDSQWIALDLGGVYKVNKVVLIWEAAYGKSYDIEISLNGTSWSKVTGESNNDGAGRKEYTFPATDARHVRMFGKTRGLEYGGFSLYEFEVYGEQQQPIIPLSPARFFMPHDNETKYWWQGENARIASLSAAFTMGAQLADPSGELWYDTLFAMATAQLDWILGKNPFAASMMHGFGPSSYRNYPGLRALPNIVGGICNGITAKHSNENDLDWKPYADDDGENWRWIEQWLPHNAWYLTAISALSHRIDNPIEPPAPIRKNNFAKSNFRILLVNGRNVNVELPFAADNRTSIDIYNMRGQKLFSHSVPAGNLRATVEMPSHIKHGAYILSVKNMAGKTVSGGFIWGR